jgi:hypothetical protein
MKIKNLKGVLGVGLSAGIVFALIGSAFAGVAAADEMEWSVTNTPSWDDLVILPDSDILDYDIGGDEGDVIYAVLEVDESCTDVGDPDYDFALVKSEDGGVTWSDITSNVTDADNLPSNGFEALISVAVAPDDEDWLAVAGYEATTGDPMVVASKDGGSNFSYTSDMVDTGYPSTLESILDMAVSIEVDDIHNIAVAGETTDAEGNDGTVYRLQAGSWLSASWEDTRGYLGWNDDGAFNSEGAVACAFSPNFDIDDTIVCMTIDDSGDVDEGIAYVQSGIWESSDGTWNGDAGFPNAVKISSDGDTLWTGVYLRSVGFALPADYDGSDSSLRAIFLYVNAWNETTELVGGYVFRLDNKSLSPVCGPSDDPLLASIDVHGDADSGKLMIGEYIGFDNDGGWDGVDPPPSDWGIIEATCCDGVSVWHTEELDFCCPDWEGTCKDPSGFYMALVMYTPDGVKEYVSTSGSIDEDFDTWSDGGYQAKFDDTYFALTDTDTGTPGDESAFSVSRDDAVSFNQIGLIDTDINYLSDVAVCPDCGTIYLSTINTTDHPCSGDVYCFCDSIWRSYDDGATWERVNYGEWATENTDYLMLRLPCDAVEDCCDQDDEFPSGTVYMAIQGTKNMYYSRDCGQCWNNPPAAKINIQDFAVESENIVYVIDDDGMFSMSTQYGRRWSSAEDTGLDSGHTIAACCEQGFIVIGGYGSDPVAWSDDGGDSWELTDDVPDSGYVHVACDPVCENIIYAAVDGEGIYRTDVTDGEWSEISVVSTDFTGIVVAREGTLYASSDNLNFDYDEDYCLDRKPVDAGTGDYVYSGVARNLDPCETSCCGTEDWDYLICGLGEGPDEYFDNQPSALKICGCLSADTNSVLWAIDTQEYDVVDGSGKNDDTGSLWSYEDCAAKHGPTLTAPADGSVLECQACAGCDSSPFTLKWERMCNACSYDIKIMDEDGNTIVTWIDEEITGNPPKFYVEYGLECGNTYTWKVREANTSCECVHSPWSETWSFTVAVGASDAIELLAPDEGTLGTPIENIGFSWSSVRDADSYSFVLSPNAALTGAIVSQDMSSTAFNYAGPLDYGKSYYWQVKAWKGSTLLTTSSIGVFSTMAEPEEPAAPVVIEETPAPVLEIPAAEQITPAWIYAIVGIGAALAVVVIVLIVRTRRP